MPHNKNAERRNHFVRRKTGEDAVADLGMMNLPHKNQLLWCTVNPS